jgi:hypothetical protein
MKLSFTALRLLPNPGLEKHRNLMQLQNNFIGKGI